MHFTTVEFTLFFFLVMILNWTLPRPSLAFKIFLLAANYFFYGCLDPRFLLILLAVSLSNWGSARLIARTDSGRVKKAWLGLDLVVNLGLLALFKYLEFFYGLWESLLWSLGFQNPFSLPSMVFPIGISFFTFQGLSYAIDVYRDRDQLAAGPLDVLLFVSFFPTIMSGPIMRARHFLPQLAKPRYGSAGFHTGFSLILSGLFKKIVIASYLSEHIVREVFQVPSDYSSLAVLAAVYAYSIQIFCDFSGYSDLAIGLALLMGFHIPENFRGPYTSTNLQEFWRRWHISLSTWLRDYLYIPLGGNKKGPGRKYLNLMITMVLGGLWHGAHWKFIIWGAFHGLGLTLTHVYKDLRSRRPDVSRVEPSGAASPHRLGPRIKPVLVWVLTFNLVSFLWVFFRAEDTARAWEIFQRVFAGDSLGRGFEVYVIPAVILGLAVQFFGHYGHQAYRRLQERLPAPLQAVVIGLLTIIILRLGPDGVLPFIYFQF